VGEAVNEPPCPNGLCDGHGLYNYVGFVDP